jgi:hypothetical protein
MSGTGEEADGTRRTPGHQSGGSLVGAGTAIVLAIARVVPPFGQIVLSPTR